MIAKSPDFDGEITMPGFAHVRAVCYVAKMSAKKAADEAEMNGFRTGLGVETGWKGGNPPKIHGLSVSRFKLATLDGN